MDWRLVLENETINRDRMNRMKCESPLPKARCKVQLREQQADTGTGGLTPLFRGRDIRQKTLCQFLGGAFDLRRLLLLTAVTALAGFLLSSHSAWDQETRSKKVLAAELGNLTESA